MRRRADEAARAARGGDLDILIGYDLRFWRELGALVGNPYITDFLHRLRVQCWVFAVPYLRSDVDVREWLWNGHPALVAAITLGEHDAVRAVIDDYNAGALMWADRLAAGNPAHPGHGGSRRRCRGDRPRQQGVPEPVMRDHCAQRADRITLSRPSQHPCENPLESETSWPVTCGWSPSSMCCATAPTIRSPKR